MLFHSIWCDQRPSRVLMTHHFMLMRTPVARWAYVLMFVLVGPAASQTVSLTMPSFEILQDSTVEVALRLDFSEQVGLMSADYWIEYTNGITLVKDDPSWSSTGVSFSGTLFGGGTLNTNNPNEIKFAVARAQPFNATGGELATFKFQLTEGSVDSVYITRANVGIDDPNSPWVKSYTTSQITIANMRVNLSQVQLALERIAQMQYDASRVWLDLLHSDEITYAALIDGAGRTYPCTVSQQGRLECPRPNLQSRSLQICFATDPCETAPLEIPGGAAGLSLWPNPVANTLYWEHNPMASFGSNAPAGVDRADVLRIVDMTGRVRLEATAGAVELDVLSPGAYLACVGTTCRPLVKSY